MMNKPDVNIHVPAQDATSVILITGAPANIEADKVGSAERVTELEAEKEVKIQKSLEITVEVIHKYHPEIIGRGGEVVQELGEDFVHHVLQPRPATVDVVHHDQLRPGQAETVVTCLQPGLVKTALLRPLDQRLPLHGVELEHYQHS